MTGNEELFKTTLMGGFDKDDVLTKVRDWKDRAYAEQKKLETQVDDKNQEIAELNRKCREKEEENEALKKEIREKYQSYIDNYDSISEMVFEAQIKAKKILQDAEDTSQKKREETEKICEEKEKETDEACRQQREETDASCRRRNQETENSCNNRIKETTEECEKMVAAARQKGEELAALYEEKLQSEAEEVQEEMERHLHIAEDRYQKIYDQILKLTSVLDESRKSLGEAFAAIDGWKQELQVSRETVDAIVRDPLKTVEENRKKNDSLSGTEKVPQAEQPEAIENSTVLSLEEEEEYLDGESDDEIENEIRRLIREEEEE